MNQPETPPAADPSMEDILASIRRILTEEPAAPAEAAEAGLLDAQTEPVPEPEVFVLDHTMLIEEPVQLADEHLLHGAPPVHAPHAIERDSVAAASQPSGEPLLAPSSAAAATASMGALVRVLGQQQTQVYRGGPTLEDMVREEMRPMVKAWLDENLPSMVERMVRAEIARVTGAIS